MEKGKAPTTNDGNDVKKKIFSAIAKIREKVSTRKKSRTPAQDRLKRLQHELKVSSKGLNTKQCTPSNNVNSKILKLPRIPKLKKQIQLEPQVASTVASQSSQENVKSNKTENNKHHTENFSKPSCSGYTLKSGNENTSKPTTLSSADFNTKTSSPIKPNVNNTRLSLSKPIKRCEPSIPIATPRATNSSALLKQKKTEKIIKSLGGTEITKCSFKKSIHSSVLEQIFECGKVVDKKNLVKNNFENCRNEIKKGPSENNYTNKNSANNRLKKLQMSLQMRNNNEECNPETKTDLPKHNAEARFPSKSVDKEIIKTIDEDIPIPDTNTMECTPMDWESIEPINAEKDPEVETKLEFDKSQNEDEDGDVIIQNILSTLLKEGNEERCDTENTYIHFVIDTNVLLSNLKFLETLRNMKFSNSLGSVIFIPYWVLQELDSLKNRKDSVVATLATRAIKYLYKQFSTIDKKIKGQTAKEAKNELINIDNPDDNILNSCLQLKEGKKKVILLTNDVNLKNKALCNKILTSSIKELESPDFNSDKFLI